MWGPEDALIGGISARDLELWATELLAYFQGLDERLPLARLAVLACRAWDQGRRGWLRWSPS